MEEFVYVKNLEEIENNILQFNLAIKESERLRYWSLSSFRKWYYSKELNMFAPAKFIGYKKMTLNRYLQYKKNNTGAVHGSILSKWFIKSDDKTLKDKLFNEMGIYGTVRKDAEVFVLKKQEEKDLSIFTIAGLEPLSRSREYHNYDDLIKARVVYEFLFHTRTSSWIDEHVIGLDSVESHGHQSMGILRFIGLIDKHKGIFKNLGIHKAIRLLEQQNSNFSLVIQFLQKYAQQDAIELELFVKTAPEKFEITETEKEQLIKSRIGQPAFKKALLAIEKKCCLCGMSDERFLVASHIKPWIQSNHKERLDVNNGLLLCPNHDSIFDKGYISFGQDGTILISNSLNVDTRFFLKINENMIVKMNESKRRYMSWHQENVYKN